MAKESIKIRVFIFLSRQKLHILFHSSFSDFVNKLNVYQKIYCDFNQ